MGACKTRPLNTTAKYYFNEVEDEINGIKKDLNDKNKMMEQRVSLICTLKNVDSSNECKIELILYSDNERKISKSGGFTESKCKNEQNLVNFENFFAIPYYFEKQQLLDFKIYNGSKNDLFQTSLGSIMGSRKQTLIKKLNDGSDIEIKGKEIKKSNKLFTFDLTIKGSLSGMGISYTIINEGTIKNPLSIKIYDSETLSTKGNSITFCRCSIPIMFLNSTGNAEENNILIEMKDVKHKKELGKYKGPIANLLNKTNSIEMALNYNNKAIIECQLIQKPSFISYLRTGMNINLTIGIDFTYSNGDYTEVNSLHYLKSGMNDYEKAIRSCGDILAYYDDDQLFPVFGFGFSFKDFKNESKDNKYGPFNYPINENIEDPNINLIDNVLKEYRKFIQKINLSGPTNFAPMIKDLNNEIKINLKNGLIMNYHILLILTDGQISDMPETIDALVEASFLPVSVIIIGIGCGNFDNMDVLDADENPLYDRNGRKADRDLVQFVPFYDYKDDPSKLAEQVLEEIPRQVVEYYQHKGIKPQEEEDNPDNKNNIDINNNNDNIISTFSNDVD